LPDFSFPVQLSFDPKNGFWGVQNAWFWGKMAFMTCSKCCKSSVTGRGAVDSFADVNHFMHTQNIKL